MKLSTLGSRRVLGLAAVAAAAGIVALPSLAATYIGSSLNTNWDNATNWNPGIPAEGENVTIADTTAQASLVLNDASHAIGQLMLGDTGTRTSAFNINGGSGTNTLTIGGGLVASSATSAASISLTVAAPVVVSGDQTWQVTGNAGSPVSDAGVSIANAVNGTPLSLNISGGKISKTGNGQLLIIGRNVGDGSIDINAGAVKLNAGNSTTLTVGGAGTITVNNTGSLFIAKNSGTLNLTKAIAVNQGGTISVGGNQGVTAAIASPIAWSGATTLNQNSTTANQVSNFTGPWTGSGTINVTLSGSGTGRAILFSGDNSGLSAQINNTAAVIGLGSDTALGTGLYRANAAGAVLRSADATNRTINNVIDLATDTTFGSTGTGELNFTSTGSSGSLIGFAIGSASKTVTILNNRTVISGNITGGNSTNAFTKAGTGILEFTNANSYDRPTTVTAGTLRLTGLGTLGSPTNSKTVTVGDDGLLDLQVAALSDAATLAVTSSDTTAEIALATGVNDTVNGLIINGVAYGPGIYGSSASGAANSGLASPDDIFSGAGTLNVLTQAPEPGTLGLAGAALVGALGQRRRRGTR